MRLFWLQASGCGGCTQSLLGDTARRGVLERLAAGGIEIVSHPALSEACGPEALAQLRGAADGRLPFDILCVEGAMLRGPNGSGRFHLLSGSGEPMIDWVRRLAQRAGVVLAIGSCTAFGGINASGDNLTEACGLQFDGAEPGGLLGANQSQLLEHHHEKISHPLGAHGCGHRPCACAWRLHARRILSNVFR